LALVTGAWRNRVAGNNYCETGRVPVRLNTGNNVPRVSRSAGGERDKLPLKPDVSTKDL
jgi:hypothetical protein